MELTGISAVLAGSDIKNPDGTDRMLGTMIVAITESLRECDSDKAQGVRFFGKEILEKSGNLARGFGVTFLIPDLLTGSLTLEEVFERIGDSMTAVDIHMIGLLGLAALCTAHQAEDHLCSGK